MRIEEVPTSLTNRTASAQASAAKDTANCKRIFGSREAATRPLDIRIPEALSR